MALLVSIDGSQVSGLLHAAITTTNYFSADSFSLTFALGKFPLERIDFWAGLSNPYIVISYFGAELPLSEPIITGTADSLIVDPIMRVVSLEGRDLSASLIDSYLQQDFANQTASEIVENIAGQHGLVAQVTVTPESVGRYFGDGYTRLSLGQFSKTRTNWDLIVQLARERNCDVFMQGNTLLFQQAVSTSEVALQLSANDVTALRLERALAITPLAEVKVQSWNAQKMAAYNTNASDADPAVLLSDTSANSGSYLFSHANLTSAQADLAALQYANEISRLRTMLHLEMPWNFDISARSLISLIGTDSSFDGLYQVDSVERRYSSVTGSSQTVRAVSWPTANELSP